MDDENDDTKVSSSSSASDSDDNLDGDNTATTPEDDPTPTPPPASPPPPEQSQEQEPEEWQWQGRLNGNADANGAHVARYTHEITDSDSDDSTDSSSTPDVSYQTSLSKNYVKPAIFHLFLPKKLPDKLQPELIDVEDWILRTFHEVCHQLQFPKIEPLTKMLETWISIQPKSLLDQHRFSHRFSHAIKEMEPNSTIPVYVRKQNCTVLITNLDETWTRVETFRASLPSETVMSNVGVLQATFPETSDVVANTELLSSPVFADKLHELAVEDFEVAMTSSVKGGKKFAEHRQVPEPFLVSDWVCGMLTPVSHHTNSSSVKLTKKIRDEVVCRRNAESLPFRRSGLWSSLKITVLLKLVQLVGNESDARVIFKTIMLKFLAEVCKQYWEESCNSDIGMDLATQLLAKLGRRVKKLQKMSCGKNSEHAGEIVNLWKTSLRFVYSVVSLLHEQIQSIWSAELADGNVMEQINVSGDQLKNDLTHSIAWLDEYIDDARSKNQLGAQVQLTTFTAENLTTSLQLQRHKTLAEIMTAAKFLDKHEPSISVRDRIWLHDTEHFVLKAGLDHETNPTTILQLLIQYVAIAVHKYVGGENPLGCSNMHLVALKLVQLLDKIATKKFPLLKQYNCGINADKFDKLLLPHSRYMKMLDEMLDYFIERDRVAYHPGILESNEIHQNSFGVRIAQENDEMIGLHKRIYSDTENKIAEKVAEVEKLRGECLKILKEIERRGDCPECKYEEVNNSSPPQKIKNILCEVCSKLAHTLDKKRTSVSVFERPLPEEEHFQQAVIFELILPTEIACLREALGLLKFDILRETLFRGKQKNAAMFTPMRWVDYKNLREYLKDPPTNRTTLVNLCSKYLSTSKTHHTRIKNPDVLSPDTSNNDFIVNNGLDCVVFWRSRVPDKFQKIMNSDLCTLQIASCVNEPLYEALQWAVDSTAHTQNRVIAECTSVLNPELIPFGSLRAGYHIQLLNLYRYVQNRELALEKEPVLLLILQTLWQVGPRDPKTGVRESHVEFQEEDSTFSLKFIEMLDKLVENNDTNYANPLILLTVIVITVRILELNKQTRSACGLLLRKCRRFIEKWNLMIDQEISKQTIENSECESPTHSPSSKQSLSSIQLQIAICSALTFNVSSDLQAFVVQDSDDIVHWFQCLSRIHQLTEEQKCENELSSFSRILLNLSRNVALGLNLEERLTTDKDVRNALHLFSCRNWVNSCVKRNEDEKNIDCWKPNESNAHVVFGEYIEENGHSHLLTYDLILGLFLVNGYPQSSVPIRILEHPLFEPYFKNSKIRVQGFHQRCVRTVDKFHGRHYEFVTFSIGDKLKIREIQEDGSSVLELLDPEMFRGFVGDELVDGYTHWVDVESMHVYFRRNILVESDYYAEHEFKLTGEGDKRLRRWVLHDEKLHQTVFSRKSKTFKNLASALSRLELESYVSVVLEENDVVTAKLSRLNLNFNLVEGRLHSVEYTDFSVALDQSSCRRGTLAGLENGLLLESIISTGTRKNVFLVPHGKLDINRQTGKQQQRVTIGLERLRNPMFFIYEFDPVLKRLKADKSKAAWLYLAALHGATSSPLPDPFTSMTGMEVAVQILQSGFVWSSSPYDEESAETLEMIRRYSPKRVYYGHGLRSKKSGSLREQMETTEWPKGLPYMAAFDGYAIVVDKLIEDSLRLRDLYQNQTELMSTNHGNEKLTLRAYYRHLSSYNKAVSVRPSHFRNSAKKSCEAKSELEMILRQRKSTDQDSSDTSPSLNLDALLRISQTRFLNVLQEADNRRKSNLSSYLLTSEPILENLPIPDNVTLKQVLCSDFRQNWLKFYTMATSSWTDPNKKHAFTLVLATLAYQGAPIDQLINLHNISVLAETISFPSLPNSLQECCFVDPVSNEFSAEKLKSELLARVSRFQYKDGDGKLKVYWDQIEIDDFADKIVEKIKAAWPCERLSKKKLEEIYSEHKELWTYDDFLVLNKIISTWYRNSQLKSMIENCEYVLDKFYKCLKQQRSNVQFDSMKEVASQINVSGWCCDEEVEDFGGFQIEGNLDEAAVIFYSGSCTETNEESQELCVRRIEEYEQKIEKAIRTGPSKHVVFMCGLAPRTSPSVLVQYLVHGMRNKVSSSSVLKCIGALAVLWTELKRFNRISGLKSSTQHKNVDAELEFEVSNPGHQNWSPVENPEWLVLELELDIMIRPVQVDVARRMMGMPSENRNGVMQLNMGEGKTSVIVPMLCLALANNENMCRVTVLHSIFKMNLSILTFAIGGLLNRRVYTFPCRRDMVIGTECLDRILECYQECLRLKGVVLTLPEHRLSFRLMCFDTTLKGYPEIGVKFNGIENGLRKYARDILDESDELLGVKYQMVYTIGTQVTVDGGKLRWVTCQKILQMVQNVADKFMESAGPHVIEFQREDLVEHPESFAYIRLLFDENNSTEFLEEFLGLLADEVLKEFKLTERQKQVVRKFLTQDKISEENFKFCMSLFKHDAGVLDEIRIISGYFRRNILAIALQKRWRVEYGVDHSRSNRRMAVPFRAKDYAAERTEFGHPDLAIILTHLSYYYSGLSDAQVQEVFECLHSKPEANMIYSSWISKINEDKCFKFLLTYAGVNLQDAYQRTCLFNMFWKHKGVVDFWLSHKVFPEEAKQFPGKIVATAWDLCSEQAKNPITGFSGTNDSVMLLPLPISQQDLPQLQDTNVRMERTLLRPENNGGHKGFRMGVTCSEILEEMRLDRLQVLIDAGALMLECDNEQVADLWLNTNSSIEAVVYFNCDNELVVKSRREHQDKSKNTKSLLSQPNNFVSVVPLELSPYRERLEYCGVFLDDQHTRGTDLKFPVGLRACVTVGSRMRRDKLMQACMRMRRLGAGHSVTFYLSHEAFTKVTQLKKHVTGGLASGLSGSSKKKHKKKHKKVVGLSVDDDGDTVQLITTQDVIHWVSRNTKEHNHEGLLYWALAGKNYAQKLAAQEFHDSVDTDALERINTLANQLVDSEELLLKDVYGTYTEAELLSKLIPEWFETTQRKILSVDGCYALSQRIARKFDFIRDSVRTRCTDHIPGKTYMSGMFAEEEQEREIEKEPEVEAEEERQIVRPEREADAADASLHEVIKKLVLGGGKISVVPGAILRLSDMFEHTSFWKLVQPECWGSDVFATADFCSVIKPYEDVSEHFKTDVYVRPIEFVVSSSSSHHRHQQLLVLSPFEVNSLMRYFRNGKAACQLHMLSARRFESQDILINTPQLQIPRNRVSVVIPDDSKALAAIMLASGNLYFSSMDEQRGFARFLALVPRPWTPEQAQAFEKEMIKKSGFLIPKYRKQQMENCRVDLDSFHKDPIGVVKKILLCRHSVVSEVAHVARLLAHNWCVEM